MITHLLETTSRDVVVKSFLLSLFVFSPDVLPGFYALAELVQCTLLRVQDFLFSKAEFACGFCRSYFVISRRNASRPKC